MITRGDARRFTRWLVRDGSRLPNRPTTIAFEFEIANHLARDEEGEDCMMLDVADALSRALMEMQDVSAIRLRHMKIGRRKLL